jgi:hypothetical protein
MFRSARLIFGGLQCRIQHRFVKRCAAERISRAGTGRGRGLVHRPVEPTCFVVVLTPCPPMGCGCRVPRRSATGPRESAHTIVASPIRGAVRPPHLQKLRNPRLRQNRWQSYVLGQREHASKIGGRFPSQSRASTGCLLAFVDQLGITPGLRCGCSRRGPPASLGGWGWRSTRSCPRTGSSRGGRSRPMPC